MADCIFETPIEFCKFNIYICYASDFSERLLFSGVSVFDLQKYIRRALSLADVYEIFIRYGNNLDVFKEHTL